MSLTKPNGAASRGFTTTYVMERLLEHGPLTLREAVEITGWKGRTTEAALVNLQVSGKVASTPVKGMRCRANSYRLLDVQRTSARVRAFAEGAGA